MKAKLNRLTTHCQLSRERLGESDSVKQEGEDLAGHTADKEPEPQRWRLSEQVTVKKDVSVESSGL